MAIKIVTDSASDMPVELAESLGIKVVPVNVIFGPEQFKDGVELSADDFYERLINGAHHPTTSAPSIGEVVQIYEQLSQDADGIVSIHVSSKLSATYGVAEQAAAQANVACPIKVIDSLQASQGVSMSVIAAAKVANSGADLDAVVSTVMSTVERSQCFVLLDTLEFLQRGGRIGKASALIGTLLRIKPMIIIRDGEVDTLGKARTYSKGVEFIKSTAKGFGDADEISVIYSTEKEVAKQLADSLSDLLPEGKEPFIARIGPGVGTHGGPRIVGVALLQSAV